MAGTKSNSITAPLMGIDRHRLSIDGRGVTTLVGLHGCPLHCKYCINDACHRADGVKRVMSVRELYDEVKCDDLYFRATGGGITFGGGEPALHSEFIRAFAESADKLWNITLETSLNVPQENLTRLLDAVDDYIVDIKSADENIYKAYTGKVLEQVIDNLNYLIDEGKASHITVRVPLIPSYNEPDDVERTIEAIKQRGIKKIESFVYRTAPSAKVSPPTRTMKSKCEILKKVRCIIAEANQIAYTPTPCTHAMCNSGHCPACEKELSMLTEILSQRDEVVI